MPCFSTLMSPGPHQRLLFLRPRFHHLIFFPLMSVAFQVQTFWLFSSLSESRLTLYISKFSIPLSSVHVLHILESLSRNPLVALSTNPEWSNNTLVSSIHSLTQFTWLLSPTSFNQNCLFWKIRNNFITPRIPWHPLPFFVKLYHIWTSVYDIHT